MKLLSIPQYIVSSEKLMVYRLVYSKQKLRRKAHV